MTVFTIITLTLILVMLSAILIRPQSKNDWRISQIENKLDVILQKSGIDYVDTSLEVVRNQLSRNRKINAVKVFRDMNPGVSLKDATKSVNAIEREMRQ